MIGTITRIDPVTEITRMGDLVDRLFAMSVPARRLASGLREFTIPVDVIEREEQLVVRAAVPGVKPEDLNITVEAGTLTLAGEISRSEVGETDRVYVRECCAGSFTRSIRLPENLDLDKVDAHFENGIVTVTLPKLPEEKPKSIKVQVTNG